MFKKLFTRKTKTEKLQQKYNQLIKLSYELSTTNRAQSDLKMAEAEAVLNELKSLEKAN